MDFVTFNELSFKPLAEHSEILKGFFLTLCGTIAKLRETYPSLRVVFTSECFGYEATKNEIFATWLENLPQGGEKNTILSIINKPYLSEKDIEPLYGYSFENQACGIEENYCWGLAFAKSRETVTISIPSIDLWKDAVLHFSQSNENGTNKESFEIINLSTKESLESQVFMDFLAQITPIVLQETTIEPKDKKVHLSGDHHGNDKLKLFWGKISKSPYVVELINSIDFNRSGTKLIKKIYNDGKIELTLYWEEDGYSMIIQTTGRNYRETAEIAKILRKKYD